LAIERFDQGSSTSQRTFLAKHFVGMWSLLTSRRPIKILLEAPHNGGHATGKIF